MRAVLCAVLLLCSALAQSYELITHGRIVLEAYRRATLYQDPAEFERLGLDPTESTSLAYYEIRGNNVWERTASTHAVSKGEVLASARSVQMGLPEHAADHTPLLWLMRGAVREDDLLFSPPPTDDPEPVGVGVRPVRVLHHFYDPIHDRPLTQGSALGERAPDWATTFRALGDVAHLIADMGQPQHTRNDAQSKRITI